MVVDSMPVLAVLNNFPGEGIWNNSQELSRKFNPQLTYGYAYFLICRPVLQNTDTLEQRGQPVHYA
jgi:hypothetical protein